MSADQTNTAEAVERAILDIEDAMVVAAMEHTPGCDHDDMVSAIEAALKAKLTTPAIDRLRSRIMELEKALERCLGALRPFANAVFNDNGDVTYDHTMYGTGDLWRAYCRHRKYRAALSSTEPEAMEK